MAKVARFNSRTGLALVALVAAASGMGACGGGGSPGSDSNGDSGNDSDGASNSDGSSDGNSSDGETVLIGVTPIPGGGSNSAPLQAGCAPETAQECLGPGGKCSTSAGLGGDVEVLEAKAVCFYGEGIEEPSATVEHIMEVVNGQEYIHLRVIFDPDFVDTIYGECSAEFGWKSKMGPGGMTGPGGMETEEKPGHTFKDLVGSDHVELKLENCEGDLSMHFRVDFISEDADAPCGYANLGVTGGEGEMIVGDAESVLAVGTSIDRNMNGCGYCDTENSPCPSSEVFAPSAEVPEWDFRMVYELWIDPDAFGGAGFCKPIIEYVHASPAKAENNTIEVLPEDCPPPPDDGTCPPNYELFLTSEGELICGGPPGDDGCEEGYVPDLTSEGELCIPAE
jgi:hypothetical protein